MKIPPKIGHNYTFIEMLDMELLHTRFHKHKRLRVFHHHGTRCSNLECTKTGEYLIKAKNEAGGIHLDIYTRDFELMTIDHIVPKSKGGNNELTNLQPMCNSCNAKKADRH